MKEATVGKCMECEGYGWVLDDMGGCGDPECCGSPVKVKCRACVNNWSPDDDDAANTRAQGGG